jgi:hypothetical protein
MANRCILRKEKGFGKTEAYGEKKQPPPTPQRTAPSSSPKGEGSHPDGKPMLKPTLKLTLIRDKEFKRGMKDGDAIKRKEIRYLIE